MKKFLRFTSVLLIAGIILLIYPFMPFASNSFRPDEDFSFIERFLKRKEILPSEEDSEELSSRESSIVITSVEESVTTSMELTSTEESVRGSSSEISTSQIESVTTSASESATEKVSETTSASSTTTTSTIEETTSEETSVKEEESAKAPHELRDPGRNYNRIAKSYAYDTKDVREAIFGVKPLAAEQRVAFLTFDDGIDYYSTPELLDVLKELEVPATFFLLGRSVYDGTAPFLHRILNEGHAIAGHSYNHDYNALYPNGHGNAQEILAQHQKTAEQFNYYLDPPVSLSVFRYPGGHMSWRSLGEADTVLAKHGVQWIDWNNTNGDAMSVEGPDPQGQVEEVKKNWITYGKPKMMVLLMHDGGNKKNTRDSLKGIVEYLRSEGFIFGILK